MNSILDYVENLAKENPKKIAIIHNEQKYDYLFLKENLINFASSFSDLPHQTPITMMFDNSIDFVITYLGIIKSGNIPHIVSPKISKENLFHELKITESKFFIISDDLYDKFNQSKYEIPFLKYSEINPKNIQNFIKLNSNDIAYLIYTSGTTSIAKGVPIKHRNSIFTTNNIIKILDYQENDVNFIPLPLYHSFGLGCLHTSLFLGATAILYNEPSNLKKMLELIDEYNSTTMAAIPITLTKLLQNESPKFSKTIKNLRLILTNSTSVPLETVKGIKKLLNNKTAFVTYYGLTEASRSTFMKYHTVDDKEASVGLPASNVSIKIIDEENNEAKEGEILIKGENVISNYWKNPSADENISQNWLRTGDIGKFDDDGYLYLLGRKDSIINVSGEKFSPNKIEKVVKDLTDVEDVVAMGINDDIFGQVVKLFIQKKHNSTITESDILIHCIQNLERFMVPKKIEFIENFPKNEFGKIQRTKLL